MKKRTGGTIAHFEVFNSSWRNAILFLKKEGNENEIRRYLGIEICPVFDCTYINAEAVKPGAKCNNSSF